MVYVLQSLVDPSMRILCFLGICSVLSPGLEGQKKGLTVIKEWKQLDWDYASEAEREEAIKDESFVPGNGLPIDTEVYYGRNGKPKIFVTVPRFQSGSPGTFNTISDKMHNGNPLLIPYPTWEWNSHSASCHENRLVSVFRTQMDECNRLWVLDTGKIGSDQLCNPQVIAFDPETDQVLHQYEIPRDRIEPSSILVTPAVDVRDPKNGCSDTFIYVADVTGFGLIVIDIKNHRSWRITNKLFYPTPEYGTFNIAGESFDLMDGILGLALSPYHSGYDRTLYFHSLASNTENYVQTSLIRNETIFDDHADAVPREFKEMVYKRVSQSAAEAMDKNGIMYFGGTREMVFYCWNSRNTYSQKNFDVIDNNHRNLQFASGVKIANRPEGNQELWVVTNRIQKVYTGTISSEEYNFRILAASTEDLTRNTKCFTSSSGGSHGGHYHGGYGFPGRQPTHKHPTGPFASRYSDSDSNEAKRETDLRDQLVFNY